MGDENFLQDARKRMEAKGTVGSFRAKAKRAGMSTLSFAREKKNAGGNLGKQANFAINAIKASK